MSYMSMMSQSIRCGIHVHNVSIMSTMSFCIGNKHHTCPCCHRVLVCVCVYLSKHVKSGHYRRFAGGLIVA